MLTFRIIPRKTIVGTTRRATCIPIFRAAWGRTQRLRVVDHLVRLKREFESAGDAWEEEARTNVQDN